MTFLSHGLPSVCVGLSQTGQKSKSRWAKTVVGQQGELAGLAIEIAQKMGGDKASAFDAQDLLSNKLGKYFIKGYNSKQPLDYQLNKHFYGVIECKKE